MINKRTSRRRADPRAGQTKSGTARYRLELETILDSMLDGVIIYDAEGRIVHMNHAAQEILDYSEEKLKLPPVERLRLLQFELESGEPLPTERNPIMRALRGESVPEEVYTIHPSKDKSVRLRMTAAPLRNEAGEFIGAVATAEDMTHWFELRLERERLLEESQLRAAQLDAVVSFVPHGLVVQGPHGDIRRMNTAAAKIFGLSVHEMRGKPFEQELINMHVEKADGAPFEMQFFPSARALSGDAVRGVPVIVHPPDGRTVWLLFSASPVFDPEGRTVGAVNTFADITSLHNLRVQREEQMQELTQTASQLEAALASMANGVMILDSEGKLVRMNDAASRILGYTAKEFARLTLSERATVIHMESPEGRPLRTEEIPGRRALEGEVVRDFRMRVRRPDGSAIWIWTAASPIIAADGSTLGVVISMTDMTGLHDLPASATKAPAD